MANTLTDIAQFEKVWQAEAWVRSEKTAVTFGATNAIRWRAKENLVKAQENLKVQFDALDLEQLRAYGVWRKELKAEIAVERKA